MLRKYQHISHTIKDVHKQIEYLVYEVWCKSVDKPIEKKLNRDLKELYENPRSSWFKDNITAIYQITKKIKKEERATFKKIFINNNKIKYLCENPGSLISPSENLNTELYDKVEPFFKEFYKKILSLKYIKDNYGTKKGYYDKLTNGHIYCLCCGYCNIKTLYDKGHSAFDHYLPIRHYPFSSINFENLVPLCTDCNSSEKHEKDILSFRKKVAYPFSDRFEEVKIEIDFSPVGFRKIIINNDDLLNEMYLNINFEPNSEENESWNSIFGIKKRYFGQVALNRGSWLGDVRQIYRDVDVNTPTYESAFDKIIQYNTNKQLGFLKNPFLKKMKTFTALIKAYEEVTGDYVIQN